jgi:serine/threonine protein kinase
MLKIIGRGTYSQVKLDGQTAIKVFKNPHDMTIRELAIIKYLAHPNIITCLNIQATINSANPTEVKLFMRAYNTNIANDVWYTHAQNPFATLKRIFVQLASAVRYCHINHVIHGDIKPENILYDIAADNVVLCDFSVSVFAPNGMIDPRIQTLHYRAPEVNISSCEVIAGSPKKYRPKPIDAGYKIDIWSLGCVFYEILTGKVFLPNINASDCAQFILHGLIPTIMRTMNQHAITWPPSRDSSLNILNQMRHENVVTALISRITYQIYGIYRSPEESLDILIKFDQWRFGGGNINAIIDLIDLIALCMTPNPELRANAHVIANRISSIAPEIKQSAGLNCAPKCLEVDDVSIKVFNIECSNRVHRMAQMIAEDVIKKKRITNTPTDLYACYLLSFCIYETPHELFEVLYHRVNQDELWRHAYEIAKVIDFDLIK